MRLDGVSVRNNTAGELGGGLYTSMTATEHVVEVETPPWRYSQPKLVQTGAQVCQQRHKVVYEKSDGACTSSRKKIILSHRKASAEPDGNFRQKRPEDCVT
jgi:predicted outer membrane repeat protein